MNSLDYAVKKVIELKSRGGNSDDSLISRPVFAELLKGGRAGGSVSKVSGAM